MAKPQGREARSVAAEEDDARSAGVSRPVSGHTRLTAAERASRAVLNAEIRAGRRSLPPAVRRARLDERFRAMLRPCAADRNTGLRRAEAAERLAGMLHGWEMENGSLSVEELMGIAEVQLATVAASGRRPTKGGRRMDPDCEELLWRCVSLEHALVWIFCDMDDELRPSASAVAAGRSRPEAALRRALRLYSTMLAQSLRARGVRPDRVVMFRDTSMRPDRPILPEGATMDDVRGAVRVDRAPAADAPAPGTADGSISI